MAPAETLTTPATDEFMQVLLGGGVDCNELETAAIEGATQDIAEASADHDLQTLRLLTEVSHLRAGRQVDGTYPQELLEGVLENLVTKVQEDAMSHAVSHSYQPVAEVRAENDELRRTFIWKGLGKTAIEVAESGYVYHSTDAAHKRVGIEVKEAIRSCEELRAGTVQMFISPRMSRADAPEAVAKQEHLYEEDAVRVYWADADDTGRVVGRRMQSLLVRDIPLDAWVAMLKDPNNLFGKSMDVSDETSALGVMELFSQLDLPEAAVPEGPVTLVAAVIPYIRDQKLRTSVEHQVTKYREDQENLRHEALATAREWLKFDQALSDGLETGIMPDEVRRLVMLFQSQWTAESRQLLKAHERGSGYRVSVELAAHLEQAWQKAYLGEVAAAVGDERALKDVDHSTAQRLKEKAHEIRKMQREGASSAEIAAMRANQLRDVVQSNVRAGGGCSGENAFQFENDKKRNDGNTSAENAANSANADASKRNGEGIGEVHVGVCRTDGCPSRPGKTRVGGCDVCLRFCQPLWDKGMNPEDIYQKGNAPAPKPVKQAGEKQYIGIFRSEKQQREKAADKMSLMQKESGKIALAGVG